MVITLPSQTMHDSWEIPQIYHTFALFDVPQIGNLMIPAKCLPQSTSYHLVHCRVPDSQQPPGIVDGPDKRPAK